MFVVLLTDPEEQVELSRILTSHREGLTIRPVMRIDELCGIETSFLRQARLIAFATSVIVPPDILASVGYGAYNFHPGPPSYPGWAPAQFALYDGASEFGVTFHEMAERVDSGTIIDATLFPVPENASVVSLCELTYVRLLELFAIWADQLSNRASRLVPRRAMQWSGRTNSRRIYRSACEIPLDITREELWRRMRAFGGNYDGIAPTINLHGIAFTSTGPAESGPP